MTQYIGIDPGQHGGLSIFDSSNRVESVKVCTMPLNDDGKIDGYKLKSILEEWIVYKADTIVTIELVGAMPGQGSVSGYTFGFGTGKIHGVVEALGLYQFSKVRPQAWKKALLGEDYNHEGKAGTIEWCQANYPNVNLIPERCRVPHDGISDALAINHYGWLVHTNQIVIKTKRVNSSNKRNVKSKRRNREASADVKPAP